MAQQSFIDQLGEKITLDYPPQRIISLVPSQTELLADLGLDQQIVGITKFCVHPENWRNTKAIVGGTKNFQMDTIRHLKPDLIIGNKEENYKEGIDALRELYPVWMSDITSLQDASHMISELGIITNTNQRAAELNRKIESSFHSMAKLPSRRVLYLIWRNPWMAAASGTFIHEMILQTGLTNCVCDRHRYPELTDDEIQALDPEVVMLSSEPYPFQQKHIEEMKALLPQAKIILVDGEMFSWYGSRLVYFPEYVLKIRQLLI